MILSGKANSFYNKSRFEQKTLLNVYEIRGSYDSFPLSLEIWIRNSWIDEIDMTPKLPVLNIHNG